MKKIISLLITCYLLVVTSTVFAETVDLSKEFSFGGIKSLGEGLGYLVGPAFAIAATAVLFYLIIGAVRLILSGGDKNAVAGARDMIVHGIIGFTLLMLMFLVLQFIPEFLGISNEFKIIK